MCNEDDSIKYGLISSHQNNFDTYLQYQFCLDDPSAIKFKGTDGSPEVTNFRIELVWCIDKPHCKSNTEIDEFITNFNMITY